MKALQTFDKKYTMTRKKSYNIKCHMFREQAQEIK